MSTDALVGTILAERYRLEALLGEGGMGKVYAAQHILMRKRLAVKVLHRQLTQVPEVVQRFEREALAAAHIDHPNVAAATDFGKLKDGSVYLVLEFVEGRSLRDEIAEGPLPTARALHIGRQMASALAAAHGLSIVHRDLKPENVMLIEKGGDPDFVKILDFGIAKVPIGDDGGEGEGKPITKAGMVYGTPEYMAPEQALGQSVDGRADLYALGVILYEMLAGLRPFAGKSQVGVLGQQLTQPVPSFAQRAPGIRVPPAVESLVLRLLAREADERLQSAVELVSSFDALAGILASDEPIFTIMGGSPSAVLDGAAVSFAATPDGSAASNYVPSQHTAPLGTQELGASARDSAAPVTKGNPVVTHLRRVALSTRDRLGMRWRQAGESIDARKQTFPAGLQKLLRDVPGSTLLAGALIATLGLMGSLLVVWMVWSSQQGDADSIAADGDSAGEVASSSSADAADGDALEPPGDQPTESLSERIEAAEQAGSDALEALAKAEPTEGLVLVALAAVRAKDGDFAGALQSVSDALAVDPKLNDNPRIAGVLFRAAQAQGTQAAAFRLLRGPMGTRGADIIYDLAHTKGVRAGVKTEAAKIVQAAEFRRSASPALEVALDLKEARSCEQYQGLLERAKNVGDARSLEPLRALTETKGCGSNQKKDCYECLRGNDELAVTIATIEKRIAPPQDHD